jgi:ribosomal-protein-alanine N-acetyltransferase
VVVVETPRLSLRTFTDDDGAFVLGLLNEPSFIQNIGDREVRTLEGAREYITLGPMASYARFGFGLYLVELKAARTPIGICGLVKRDQLPEPDLGYALLPAYHRQGYAAEAAAAVRDYARDAVRLTQLLAIVNPANDSSIRLLGRLGFSFTALTQLTPDADPLNLYTCTL